MNAEDGFWYQAPYEYSEHTSKNETVQKPATTQSKAKKTNFVARIVCLVLAVSLLLSGIVSVVVRFVQ